MTNEDLIKISGKSSVLKKHLEKAKAGIEEYKTAINSYEELLKTVNYDKTIVKIFIFVLEKHEGQYYEWKNQKKLPYAYHLAKCATIISKLRGAKKQHIILALLHDIIEDKRATENEVKEELSKEEYVSIEKNTDELIKALMLLDKNNFHSDEQYYKQILQNTDASIVKTADILANLNECIARATEMLQNEQRFWIYEYLAQIPKYFSNPEILQKLAILRKEISGEQIIEFEKHIGGGKNACKL